MKSAISYQPLVSVVMPVYNAASTVKQAIQSILYQTYTHFEFIIVNDGSTDNSLELINGFTDQRIKVIHFAKNQGIVAALNKGVAEAKGDFIARMDADDESLPERFQYQLDYMRQHPEIGVCGTWFRLHTGKVIQPPSKHHIMLYELMNRSVFHHASIMIRADVIKPFKQQLYDARFEFTEDLELWMRLIRTTTFGNVEQVLLVIRANQGTHRAHQKTVSTHNVLLKQLHLEYLFPKLSKDDVLFLAQELNRIQPKRTSQQEFSRLMHLLNRLYQENADSNELFTALQSAVWFKLASNAPRSFGWLLLCRHYIFAQTSFWQKGWLLAKPVLKAVKA